MTTASSVIATTPRVGLWSHPWVRFGVRRLGRLLVSLWVLVTASFLMIHLIPGDPVRAALGPTAPGRPGRGQAARRWGSTTRCSCSTGTTSRACSPVTSAPRSSRSCRCPRSSRSGCPATLALAFLAFLVAVAIAVPLGVCDGGAHPARPRTPYRARLHHHQRRCWGSSPTSCSASGSSTSSRSASAGCRSPATTPRAPTCCRWSPSRSARPRSWRGSSGWRW